MRRLRTAYLAVLCSASGFASGEMRLELVGRGDTLVRTIAVAAEYRGEESLERVGQPYDPSLQSVRLLEARTRSGEGEWRPVPEWARERVDGTGGYPMSLQLAFTGLHPGDSLRWTLEHREWGPRASGGPWLVLPPPEAMDSVEVVLDHSPPGVRWSGAGWERGGHGDGLRLVSGAEGRDTLWVSTIGSWRRLGELMLAGVPELPADSLPPDLREAALQASAAGADPWSQLCLARTLLTESFAIRDLASPPAAWRVRSIQRILDSRRATHLELAVVLSAMCSVLGMEAEILPASGFRPVLPVPAGWDRFLLRVCRGRRSWTVDPAATLAQADHVPDRERLWTLRMEADTVAGPPGAPSTASLCRERWRLQPDSGRFVLTLYCRGDYDAVLRRRMAGLQGREDEAAFSLWLWQSGSTCVADSVETDESLFRLERPVEVVVRGRLGYSARTVVLPELDWNLDGASGQIRRSWTLPGRWEAPEGLSALVEEGRTVLSSELPDGPPAVVVSR